MSFIYDGKHLLVDCIVKDPKILVDADLGNRILCKIVHDIDMTMILPPVTVKFPHAVCELKRLVSMLEVEGLGESNTAKQVKKDLALREAESYGYSSFVMIAESHISIHTFPELNYFSFDCYSCKDFKEDLVMDVLHKYFDILSENINVCRRGIPIEEPPSSQYFYS